MESKNTPLVTVLMPCYNAMPFLEEALMSITNQTYRNLEILCINDGSLDNTGEVLEQFAKNDDRIKVINNEVNLKLIGTLNNGVSLAKGEYIARMDADDVCLPERIEKQLNYLFDTNSDIVGCNAFSINEDGETIGNHQLKNISANESTFASFLFTPLIHPTVLGKKDVFQDNPYLKEEKALHTEDYELWCRLIRKGYKISNLEDRLFKLRANSQSVSSQFEEIQKINFATCAKEHFENHFNVEVKKDVYDVVVNRFKTLDRKALNKPLSIIDSIGKDLNFKSDKRIKMISSQQKTDILIQVLRKQSTSLKFIALFKLLGLLIKNLFNSQYMDYLKQKRKAS
tara:strand:+ start:506 stop:1531 length:1026 start_codon:yes stop_codon:yes gene_type:complete